MLDTLYHLQLGLCLQWNEYVYNTDIRRTVCNFAAQIFHVLVVSKEHHGKCAFTQRYKLSMSDELNGEGYYILWHHTLIV